MAARAGIVHPGVAKATVNNGANGRAVGGVVGVGRGIQHMALSTTVDNIRIDP